MTSAVEAIAALAGGEVRDRDGRADHGDAATGADLVREKQAAADLQPRAGAMRGGRYRHADRAARSSRPDPEQGERVIVVDGSVGIRREDRGHPPAVLAELGAADGVDAGEDQVEPASV